MWSFPLILAIYCGLIAIPAIRSQRTARRLSSLPWRDLVTELAPVRHDEMRRACAQYAVYKATGDNAGFRAAPAQIGGDESIRRIKTNARILLKLASFCEDWSPSSSTGSIATMVNHEISIRHASAKYRLLSKYGVSLGLGSEGSHTSRYLAEISYHYCSMTAVLLALYRETNIAHYSRVRAACS